MRKPDRQVYDLCHSLMLERVIDTWGLQYSKDTRRPTGWYVTVDGCERGPLTRDECLALLCDRLEEALLV